MSKKHEPNVVKITNYTVKRWKMEEEILLEKNVGDLQWVLTEKQDYAQFRE